MLVFPTDYDSRSCVLVPINVAMVPILSGALLRLSSASVWANDDSYERGYNALAEVLICMTGTCTQGLQQSLDRLFMLLDGALYGRQYSLANPETGEIVPPLPEVPDTSASVGQALAVILPLLQRQNHNALTGAIYPDAPNPRGIRQQLDELIAAVQAGAADDEDVLAALLQIVALLA